MARPPSYDFERRERAKAKAAKKADKQKAKNEKKAGEAGAGRAQDVVEEMDVAIAEDVKKD